MWAGAASDSRSTVIEPRELLGVRHPRPQLERALGEVGSLAVGVDVAGGERGPDRRAQRGRLVAGGRVVVGDRGGELDLAIRLPAEPLLERLRERKVELAALAWQQIVVQGLAQQRVAEAQAPVVAGDSSTCSATASRKRGVKGLVLDPGDLGDRPLVERAPDGDRSRRPLGVARTAARSAA